MRCEIIAVVLQYLSDYWSNLTMSLAQLADGILSTYVTWDDIQIDVLKIFGEGAKFGPNKNATDIGAGKTYLMRKFSEENPLKGYIIMDYVDNGVPIHIFDNLTPEDLHQTTSNLITIFRRFGGERLAERIDKLEKLFPFIVDISLAERLSEELSVLKENKNELETIYYENINTL
uniref:DUF2326 domain-containing protein n=1 Tax=Heterorhabditis bacteriophora TaxID=37862 RepID=A0A1I7X6K1_HETBA